MFTNIHLMGPWLFWCLIQQEIKIFPFATAGIETEENLGFEIRHGLQI